MGIDYGTKRVGIALSDESGTMAFPHAVLPNTAELTHMLTEIISKEAVGSVVIGHSLDRAGKENKVHEAVRELVGDLTLEVGVPVHLEPEQYTTQESLRIQGRTDKTDASAAALILDGYLRKQK